MTLQIAVCGSAPSSRLLAPFRDDSWEIWACSPQNYDFPRVDAWFELHSLDRKFVPANQVYRNVIQAHRRVYITEPDGRLPHGIVLDMDPLLKKHGPYFFTSSLAWMMAFAIEQKPDTIGIWGVDMSAAEEYGYQRAGMHYFMHVADKAGIKVVLPPQCDLAQSPPLYGVKEFYPMYWKMRACQEELEQRVNALNKDRASKEKEALILQGARDFLEYIKNTWLMDTRPYTLVPTPEKSDTNSSAGFPTSNPSSEMTSKATPPSPGAEPNTGTPVPS